MKQKLTALLGFVLLLSFSACEKEDDNTEDETPKTTSTSIEGTWKITAQTGIYIEGADTTFDDSYSQMDPCMKDDLYRFNANKTITFLSGATKCDPNEMESEQIGTWNLTNNNKQLALNFDGDILNAQVETMTTTTLKLVISERESTSSYTVYTTYTRQ